MAERIRLPTDEIRRAAEVMVDHAWSWTADDLDGLLVKLGVERPNPPNKEVVLLALKSDRMPGIAGIVEGLTDGRIEAVGLYLSSVVKEDDRDGQHLLDQLTDEAIHALHERFGKGKARLKKKRGRRWPLGEVELAISRLDVAVVLCITHRAHRDAFLGK